MSILEMEQFAKEVRNRCARLMNVSEEQIRIVDTRKYNNTMYKSLIFATDESNCYSTIHLNRLFDFYKEGALIDNICFDIVQEVRELKLPVDYDVLDWVKDFEKCKENIYPVVINTQMNEEMLKTVPHIEKEDLSIIFRIKLDADSDEAKTSLLVTNAMLSIWEISSETLYELAEKNAPKLDPPKIMPLLELMFDTQKEFFIDELNMSEAETKELLSSRFATIFEQLVVTNTSKINGAYSIFLPEVIDELGKRFGDEYLLVAPSSIHEVIVSKYEEDFVPLYVEVVKEANEDVVGNEEVLSNTVYVLDVNRKQLVDISRWEDYKKELDEGLINGVEMAIDCGLEIDEKDYERYLELTGPKM